MERLTEGETGSCSDGWGRVRKSFIQFSVDGRNCVPSLLFDLRPNYGGGNEENGGLLQKVPCRHCCMQCPQPCSRPPLTTPPPGVSGHWRVRSVSCGVTAPFSWVLVHIRFCLCPPGVCFPRTTQKLSFPQKQESFH